MTSPIIPSSSTDSLTTPLSTSYTNADLTITNSSDTISLYAFLNLVSTVKDVNKQTVFDGQEVDALINKEYFLGIYLDINALLEKLHETENFSDSYTGLVNSYNSRVSSLNTSIDNYNINANGLNSATSTMNNAINTINGIASPTASDIATYNAAVAAYNSYMTSTGNPGLLSYKNSEDDYNIPTNIDNTVTIPAINHTIDDLNIGIPHIPSLTPTAPVGADTIPALSNYSGGTIPLISPASYSHFGAYVPLIAPAPSKQDIINTYFVPYAQNYLATMAAVSKKLSGIDDYRAFINFILKQGFNLNPASVDAFIQKADKPSLPSSSSSPNGTIGSLIVGVDSPNLELTLSTALFKALGGQEAMSLPPHVYDQINVFALSLLSTIGASAGLGVAKILGDSLKSLKPDNPAVDIAVAAAILQNILKVIVDGKAKDGLAKIINEIPGLTDAQKSELTADLATAQNTTLLLQAGLSTAISLKSPNLIQDFVNTAYNQSTSSNQTDTSLITDSDTTELPDNPFSPKSLNDYLKSENNALIVKKQLSDRLENLVSSNQPTQSSLTPQSTANAVINTTIASLPENATSQDFNLALSANLQRAGLSQNDGQSIAADITASINLQVQPLPIRPTLTPAQLAAQTEAAIREIIKGDATKSLPEAVLKNIVKNLTDVTNPNSFISLLTTQVQTLVDKNDKAVETELNTLLRSYMSPTLDTFVIAENIRSPANNVVLSFMTGLMYDRSIPSNWQRPLSIQV